MPTRIKADILLLILKLKEIDDCFQKLGEEFEVFIFIKNPLYFSKT